MQSFVVSKECATMQSIWPAGHHQLTTVCLPAMMRKTKHWQINHNSRSNVTGHHRGPKHKCMYVFRYMVSKYLFQCCPWWVLLQHYITLRLLFFIVECGIACFLCPLHVFDFQVSSSSPSLPLWPHLVSFTASIAELAHGEKSHTQSLTQLIWCPGNNDLHFWDNMQTIFPLIKCWLYFSLSLSLALC